MYLRTSGINGNRKLTPMRATRRRGNVCDSSWIFATTFTGVKGL